MKNEIYRIVCIEMVKKDLMNKCFVRLLSISSNGFVFSCTKDDINILIDFINHTMRSVSKKYLKKYIPDFSVNIV
ncbi:MAG: hypothetical protein MJA82_09130, partial [Clostridia bacterium]|nr:hypothetical protein [Clostridia bacterium]